MYIFPDFPEGGGGVSLKDECYESVPGCFRPLLNFLI